MTFYFSAESQLLQDIGLPLTLFEVPRDCQGIIALDEVGRGCLAGSVVTAASIWVPSKSTQPQNWIRLVDDSKALSANSRNKCFEEILTEFPHLSKFDVEEDCTSKNSKFGFEQLIPPIHEHICFQPSKSEVGSKQNFQCMGIELGAASVCEIDSFNIWNATQISFGRALKRILNTLKANELSPPQLLILIDGKSKVKIPLEFAETQQITSIGGDGLFRSIGCSSVVAKVIRDRYIAKAAESMTEYGLSDHKGYATKKHREAIRLLGPTLLHRKSFLGNIL